MRNKLSFFAFLSIVVPLFLSSNVAAQVQQDPTNITNGRAAKQLGPDLIGDSGPATGGPVGSGLSELGITNNTPCGLGITSGPITVGYRQLCIGFDGSGNLLFNFGAVGLSNTTIYFEKNGVLYEIPFTLSGVVGPVSTTVNDVACWNNSSGTLLKDGAPCTVFDTKTTAITADNWALSGVSQSALSGQAVYNQAVMSGNSTTFNGYDALRGVANAPSSSTVNTITGVAGYTINNTVPIGQRSQTVALFGVGVCQVNGSQCWGVDTIVSDNPSQNNTGVTAGTAKFLTNEFDLNVTSPNTTGNGLAIGGTALPASTTLGINGVAVNKLWGSGGAGTGTSLFANGFITADACCATGVLIGVNALSGTSIPSMPLTLNYRDGAGVLQNETLAGFAGTLFVGGTASYGIKVSDGAGGDNAFATGAHAASGTNIASHFILFNYFDAGSAAQNYNLSVNTSRTFVFAASVNNATAKFDFEGGLAVNGNSGVTCAPGAPTALFQTTNGLVVHC